MIEIMFEMKISYEEFNGYRRTCLEQDPFNLFYAIYDSESGTAYFAFFKDENLAIIVYGPETIIHISKRG